VRQRQLHRLLDLLDLQGQKISAKQVLELTAMPR
jgi:hypothetical protein